MYSRERETPPVLQGENHPGLTSKEAEDKMIIIQDRYREQRENPGIMRKIYEVADFCLTQLNLVIKLTPNHKQLWRTNEKVMWNWSSRFRT